MDTQLVQMGMPQFGASVPETAFPLPARASASAAPQIKLPASQLAQPEGERFDAKASEQARRQDIREAAQLMANDIYVVGDMKFSIYKDLSGQFVTRFTSLRDGAVTYIPEQDMMVYLESRGARRKALFQLDV